MKRAFTLALALAVSVGFATDGHRAVLINGFKRAEAGWFSGVEKELSSMKEYLGKIGYQVDAYSAPITDYGAIRNSMNGASMVIYWGHGVIHGSKCFAPESSDVGGFSIDGKYISPEELVREVRLAPGAWVILPNSCYAAGNCSEDGGVLTQAVAERRMKTYADAFFRLGGSGYLACANPRRFIEGLYHGDTVPEAYGKASYSKKVVKQDWDGKSFWYSQQEGKKGISFSSALIWRRK